MLKGMVSASFTNGIGSVTFEDGTKKEMTYGEYILLNRNYNPSSLAKLIKHIQEKGAFFDAGHRRPLQYVFTNGEYHFFHGKDMLTKIEYANMMKLLKRYQRFYNYIKEVSPQWRKVRLVHWADNSIDEIQVNKYGEERKVMLTAPHGDACY